MNNKKNIGSLLLHDSRNFEKTESHIQSLHLTSSFKYKTVEESVEVFSGRKDGHVYSRYGNPNIEAVAQKIADLETINLDETGRAFFTSNGMSAIYTILRSLQEPKSKLLTQGDLYGGTTELLSKVLMPNKDQIITMDFGDLESIRRLLQSDASIDLIYLETPTNPTCTCVDLERVSELAKEFSCTTIVDNTFSTPYLQRPFESGIDYIIHSTTKYLNGHGTGLGGCIVGLSKSNKLDQVWNFMKLMGSTGNPFDAWLVYNGMKTLKLRMDQHSKNAQALSEMLYHHAMVEKVFYPGLESHASHKIAKRQMSQFGGMLSFSVKGGEKEAMKVMNTLKIATIAPTLGDVDTLVLHPYSSSHLKVPREICAQFGISDNLIRVSVGIEETVDILDDFNNALKTIG